MTVPNTFGDKDISIALGDLDENFTYFENRVDNVVTGNVTATTNVSTGNVLSGNVFVTTNVRTGNLIVSVNIVSSNIFSSNLSVGNVTVTTNVSTGNLTVSENIISSNIFSSNLSVGNVTSTTNISTGNVLSGNVFVTTNVSTGNLIVSENIVSSNIFSSNLILPDLSSTGVDLTGTGWATSPVFRGANGTIQFNKNSLYATVDNTQGEGYIPAIQFRYLTSNTIFGAGGFISTAELPFMGNSNGVILTANSAYEIEWQTYFLKTTAGTVTFNIRFRDGVGVGSAVNPQLVNATYVGGAASVVAAACTAARIIGTADPFNLPVTPSLTDNTLYSFNIKAFIITNSTTSGNCYLSVSTSAGRVTPNTGSYMKVTKLPRSNVGIFS